MKSLSEFLQALATLLWPMLVLAVILLFRPVLQDLIGSAKSRKFTLKIGGQELSMDEANEQQQLLISDLQSQVAEIRKSLDMVKAGSLTADESLLIQQNATQRELSYVLWVDDAPKNNSYFIEELSRLGVRVDLAQSSEEGMSKFRNRAYDTVISDMGRRENSKYNARAGLDLLTLIRELNSSIPFVIFCGTKGVRQYRDEALALKATGITASASELYALLNLEKLKNPA